MHDSCGQSCCCPRPYLEVDIGQGSSSRGLTRIDNNELDPPVLGIGQLTVAHKGHTGIGWICAPNQHDPGLLSRQIAQGWKSIGQKLGQLSSSSAGGRALAAIVGRTISNSQPLNCGSGLFRIANIKEDLMGAVVLFNPMQLGGYDLIGLFPGYRGEGRIRFSLGPGSFQRIQQSVGILESLECSIGLGAER